MELKVPPPLVALALCMLMWAVAQVLPGMEMAFPGRNLLALLMICTAMAFSGSGILAFRKAQTTVDPRYPHKASRLVNRGIYRITRNPMYVGMFWAISAWAIHLANPLNVLALPLYVWFITRYQIRPEEAALRHLFGIEYESYCARVRRWL